ncbi:RelA/SpoT AH/RIS domain-containing protein [Ruminococcus sp.]|uniref:RelA/SpoT AH/RIS domain-containing protein n=1 Tax=Ruminococcus sp. TaxID=41978 RepID=UPI00300E8D6B
MSPPAEQAWSRSSSAVISICRKSEWAEFLADDLKRHNCDTVEDFYASIGYGGITLSKIMPRLKEVYVKTHGADEEKESAVTVPTKELSPQKKSCIILDKINDCAFKFSQCCNPLPGEEIVGFVTRGHGISVHSVNCVNYQAALKRNDPEEMARWLPVRWSENTSTALIPTSIEVVAF